MVWILYDDQVHTFVLKIKSHHAVHTRWVESFIKEYSQFYEPKFLRAIYSAQDRSIVPSVKPKFDDKLLVDL